MSGFFVGLIEFSMLFTFFITLPLLMIIRLIAALKASKKLSSIILIVLVPFSLGYYKLLKDEEKPQFYQRLLKILVVIAVIGISFTLFQLVFPRYDYFI